MCMNSLLFNMCSITSLIDWCY
nr:unnamed protein product [Callosobruchus chinensis]